MPGRRVGGGGGRSRSSSHRSSHRSSYRSSHHSHRHSNYNRYHYSSTGGSSNSSSAGIVFAIFLFIVFISPILSDCTGIQGDAPEIYETNDYEIGHYEKIDTTPSVHNTEYVEDNVNVIECEKDVIRALRYFEKKTGICPVLVTEKNIGDCYSYYHTTFIEEYVVDQYEKRFDDEQHMLFYYFSDMQGEEVIWAETGDRADKYMDDIAWDVLFDEVESYLIKDKPQLAFTKGFMTAADKLSEN